MNGLIKFCAESTSLSESAIASVFDSLRIYIAREIRNGSPIRLDRLGTFSGKLAPAHTSRNPRTGEPVNVPEKFRPVFKFVNSFIESVQPFDPNSAEQLKNEAINAELNKSLGVSYPVGETPITNAMMLTNTPIAVKNWYAALLGKTIELPESALINSGVDKETLVWCQGMPSWEYAGKVPELAYLFVKNPFPPLPPLPTK